MTRLPVTPRLSPMQVRRLLRDNLEGSFLVQPTAIDGYLSVLDRLADAGLSGGIIYDALILEGARQAEIERLYTLNRKDFLRIAPDWEARLVEPN